MRFPAKGILSLARICNQFLRVPVAPWLILTLDGFSSYFFTGLDDFTDGVTATRSKIIESSCIGFDGLYVRFRQILDVNVITNASPVRVSGNPYLGCHNDPSDPALLEAHWV